MKDYKRIHYKVLLLIEFYNKFNRWPKQREKYKDVNIGSFFSCIKNKYIYIYMMMILFYLKTLGLNLIKKQKTDSKLGSVFYYTYLGFIYSKNLFSLFVLLLP